MSDKFFIALKKFQDKFQKIHPIYNVRFFARGYYFKV